MFALILDSPRISVELVAVTSLAKTPIDSNSDSDSDILFDIFYLLSPDMSCFCFVILYLYTESVCIL